MKLNFLKSGTGKPIILLHGLFGSASNLGNVARALEAKFCVYSVDLRNHGRSPHAARMNLELMATDIAQLLDDQSLDAAHMLGHSLGGKVAMQLALDDPSRVKKLVVADIAPVPYAPHHKEILSGMSAIAGKVIESRKQADEMLRDYVEEPGVRGFLLKSLARNENGIYEWELNLDGIKENYAKLVAGNSQGSFPGEALFVKGEKSDYIKDEYKDEISTRFPNAKFETIESAGHWLHAEKPKEFTKIVLNFLNA